MSDPVRRLARSERGETLVEFALASTVFFMVIFGTIEYSLAVGRYNMVSDLAQEGARWATVHGLHSLAPADWVDVQNYVDSRAMGMTVPVTLTFAAPGTLSSGQTVTVEVTNSFTPLTTLIPHATLTLRSTAKMVMAR